MKNEELEAMTEPKITGNSLLEEIKPLLEDYFIGDISLDCGGIIYRLPNGQRFIITAQAV